MAIDTRGPIDRRAWALFAVVTALFALGAIGYAINGRPVAVTDWGLTDAASDILLRSGLFTFPLVGAFVASRQPRNAVGWILLVIGVVWSVGLTLDEFARYGLVTNQGELPGSDLAFALASQNWIPGMGLIGTFLLLLFPDGQLPSPRWKAMAWLSGFTLVFVSLVSTLGTEYFTAAGFGRVRNPLWIDSLGPLFHALGPVLMLLPVCIIGCAAGLAVRFRRSHGVERLQLKWLVVSGGAAAFFYLAAMGVSLPFWANGSTIPFAVSVLQEVAMLSFVLIPIAAGIAILRYRLYNVDVIINRSLVYGALTVLVVAVYTAVVLTFEQALSERISFGPALLATAVVALGFAPARERVQSRVDRLLYGERRDPYRAVSKLATRLEASLALDEVMPAVVESVATALRLPWAEIRVHGGDKHAVWTHGAKGELEEVFPLRYRGEPVGELVIGPRRGETELDPSDRKLLEQLAAQAGAAANAVSLSQALQHSRERLVVAREEERRRLRRDLHDGLGPALTAATMKIDRIRGRVKSDPEEADRLLHQLRAEVKGAIDDIRRLVYELRPPALDELGLVGALREQAARFMADARNGDRMYVDFDSPDVLPELPAAAEVAAYRIASEAITNAARHAGARHCAVRIAVDGDLSLEVVSDGVWRDDWRPGIGISSMRERAAELGGALSAGPMPKGGGRVAARIPLSRR